MKITLESIAFNHNPTFETTGAFYVRQNETEIIQLPEWEKDRCTTPNCAPVAYAIDRVPQAIVIKASFRASGLESNPIWIKAFAVFVGSKQPRSANLLGDTDSVRVEFVDNKADAIVFHISSEKLRNVGTSASDQNWSWQYSADAEKWFPFQATCHRVYVVPKTPARPWEPDCDSATNIQVPWTEALEYACHWAAGVTKDVDLATTMITRRVYALGKTLVMWQSLPVYSPGLFDLTGFLALLKDRVGDGQALNCDDCATIVSTFANLLGAELWQSSMGTGVFFTTNPILAIGHSVWQTIKFSHHTVAWKGACLENDDLFDACLQVDGDPHPDRPPQFPEQPTRVRFGQRPDQGFRFALTADPQCKPTPKLEPFQRQRRKFGKDYLGARPNEFIDGFAELKRSYRFEEWPKDDEPSMNSDLIRSFEDRLGELIFDNWSFHKRPEYFRNERFKHAFQAIIKTDDQPPRKLITLNAYQCRESTSPNEAVFQLLIAFQTVLLRLDEPSFGQLAFAEEEPSALLFRDGPIIGLIRSVGLEDVSVLHTAKALYQFIV
jgi:hypothetical protein